MPKIENAYDSDFIFWANSFNRGEADSSSTPKGYLKNMRLVVFNETGQVITAYKVHRCWISDIRMMPESDAMTGAVAIERLQLENEGWELETDGQP